MSRYWKKLPLVVVWCMNIETHGFRVDTKLPRYPTRLEQDYEPSIETHTFYMKQICNSRFKEAIQLTAMKQARAIK